MNKKAARLASCHGPDCDRRAAILRTPTANLMGERDEPTDSLHGLAAHDLAHSRYPRVCRAATQVPGSTAVPAVSGAKNGGPVSGVVRAGETPVGLPGSQLATASGLESAGSPRALRTAPSPLRHCPRSQYPRGFQGMPNVTKGRNKELDPSGTYFSFSGCPWHRTPMQTIRHKFIING